MAPRSRHIVLIVVIVLVVIVILILKVKLGVRSLLIVVRVPDPRCKSDDDFGRCWGIGRTVVRGIIFGIKVLSLTLSSLVRSVLLGLLEFLSCLLVHGRGWRRRLYALNCDNCDR